MQKKRQLTNRVARDGNELADWLNDKTLSLEARERVAAITRDLATVALSSEQALLRFPDRQSLQAVRAAGISKDTTLPELMSMGIVESWKEVDTGLRSFDEVALSRAAEALDRYRFRPYVNLARNPRNVHAFPIQLVPANWKPSPTVGEVDNAKGKWPVVADKRRGSLEDQEAWMVLLITGLSIVGEIARLRECECGKWFYAQRFDRQRCVETCRKTAYRASPQQLEKRQIYMRKYMQEKRKRNKQMKAKGEVNAEG